MDPSITLVPLTLDQLDQFVGEVNAIKIEDGHARSAKLTGHYVPYMTDFPHDPFSEDYKIWVLRCWAAICGKPKYSNELEKDPNVQPTTDQLKNMFPFSTMDPFFIGQYWIGVYLILQQLVGLPSNEVVEYGIGWGHTTTALLKAGFDVTAIDIEKKWLQLIELRERMDPSKGKLRCFHGEFGKFPDSETKYAAAIFYECFHHSLDHDSVISSIAERLLDEGIIVFAAETIYSDFPIPWGVRQDGHSVWAIRNFGWMELGFSEDYFILLLRRHGLTLRKAHCKEAGPSGLLYVAQKNASGVAMGRTILHSRESGFYPPEASPDIHTRFTSGNATLYMSDGHASLLSIELKNWLPCEIKCSITHDNVEVWQKTIAANDVVIASFKITRIDSLPYVRIVSDAFVPKDLGINDDQRLLGIAIGRVSFRAP
jgi:SAM-dependent methyltransferase